MYDSQHDDALVDYSHAIELEPADAGHWRRRSHAHTIAPTPQPEKGIEDATRAIELDPDHPIGYGHRAIAFTQLPTPDWQNALADMDRHIGLFTSHDPEAYRLRAWIHDNLDNHQEAERDRRVVHRPTPAQKRLTTAARLSRSLCYPTPDTNDCQAPPQRRGPSQQSKAEDRRRDAPKYTATTLSDSQPACNDHRATPEARVCTCAASHEMIVPTVAIRNQPPQRP